MGSFVSASADVISVEIAGAALSARRKFLVRRRDRHARNTAREPALICASSEINPFYPERDSISIFALVATRKVFTAPGNERKTNCARRKEEKEEEQWKTRNLVQRAQKTRKREKERERLISRAENYENFGATIDEDDIYGERNAARRRRPLESFAITELD